MCAADRQVNPLSRPKGQSQQCEEQKTRQNWRILTLANVDALSGLTGLDAVSVLIALHLKRL